MYFPVNERSPAKSMIFLKMPSTSGRIAHGCAIQIRSTRMVLADRPVDLWESRGIFIEYHDLSDS